SVAVRPVGGVCMVSAAGDLRRVVLWRSPQSEGCARGRGVRKATRGRGVQREVLRPHFGPDPCHRPLSVGPQEAPDYRRFAESGTFGSPVPGRSSESDAPSGGGFRSWRATPTLPSTFEPTSKRSDGIEAFGG